MLLPVVYMFVLSVVVTASWLNDNLIILKNIGKCNVGVEKFSQYLTMPHLRAIIING